MSFSALDKSGLDEITNQEKYALDEIARQVEVEKIESTLLEYPQEDCPVIHTFGPGLYIRELRLPAGVFAIGHKQKYDHMNLFLRGRMLVPDGEGDIKEVTAPAMFTAPPGRKVGYVLEDVVWLNIYPVEETDVETLEEMFFEKSDTWREFYKTRRIESKEYAEMLEQIGVSEETVRTQSEDTGDIIPMPYGSYKFATGRSGIEGTGVFATAKILPGEVIGPAKIGDNRTLIGRYINHSGFPNAAMQSLGNNVYLVALQDIPGCKGGEMGEEITINYHQMNKNIRGEICQEQL